MQAELDGHDHKEGTQSEKMDLEEDSWAKEEKTPLSFSSSSLPVASLSPDSCTFTLTGFDTGVVSSFFLFFLSFLSFSIFFEKFSIISYLILVI